MDVFRHAYFDYLVAFEALVEVGAADESECECEVVELVGLAGDGGLDDSFLVRAVGVPDGVVKVNFHNDKSGISEFGLVHGEFDVLEVFAVADWFEYEAYAAESFDLGFDEDVAGLGVS